MKVLLAFSLLLSLGCEIPPIVSAPSDIPGTRHRTATPPEGHDCEQRDQGEASEMRRHRRC